MHFCNATEDDYYDYDKQYEYELNNTPLDSPINAVSDTVTSQGSYVLPSVKPSVKRVQMKGSPIFNAFYKHMPLPITLDTGAETNLKSKDYTQFPVCHTGRCFLPINYSMQGQVKCPS